MGRKTSLTRKPAAYGGLLVTTYAVRSGYRGLGEVPVGPQWEETSCSPPCSTALPSNLGTPAYVKARAAAVRAFVLVTVLKVVRTGW